MIGADAAKPVLADSIVAVWTGLNCEPFLRTFGINEEQEQPERQLVSRKLLQTLSTGASCQRLESTALHTLRMEERSPPSFKRP